MWPLRILEWVECVHQECCECTPRKTGKPPLVDTTDSKVHALLLDIETSVCTCERTYFIVQLGSTRACFLLVDWWLQPMWLRL